MRRDPAGRTFPDESEIADMVGRRAMPIETGVQLDIRLGSCGGCRKPDTPRVDAEFPGLSPAAGTPQRVARCPSARCAWAQACCLSGRSRRQTTTTNRGDHVGCRRAEPAIHRGRCEGRRQVYERGDSVRARRVRRAVLVRVFSGGLSAPCSGQCPWWCPVRAVRGARPRGRGGRGPRAADRYPVGAPSPQELGFDWSRCVVDSSHVRVLKGGATRAPHRSTGVGQDPGIT